MSGRLDGWTWVDNPRSGGGTFDPDGEGYPYRIVLHTIEGRGFPNLSAHQYPPQLWYNPATREKAQTVPLDRAGFALWQGSDAPYYTNRARALQVEMVGYAEEAGSWPDEHLVNIAQDVIVPLVEWVRAQGSDIDLSDPAVPLAGAIPNSAREDAPQRLDPHVWAFGPIGLCGHRHVPMGDDHWDTGSLDLRKIAAYARELLGTSGVAGTITPAPQPEPPEDDDVRYSITDTDGTLYFVVNLDAYPLSAYAKSVHDATGLSAEFPPKKDKGGGDLRIDKESIRLSYVVHSVDDDVTLASIQQGVNNSYANLNATLTILNGKVGVFADSVATAVVAQVGKGGTALDLEAVRQVVHEELFALVFKPAA